MATRPRDLRRAYSCQECHDYGWMPREEVLRTGDAEHIIIETWWEPCETCNREASRVPRAPDSEPYEHFEEFGLDR